MPEGREQGHRLAVAASDRRAVERRRRRHAASSGQVVRARPSSLEEIDVHEQEDLRRGRLCSSTNAGTFNDIPLIKCTFEHAQGGAITVVFDDQLLQLVVDRR